MRYSEGTSEDGPGGAANAHPDPDPQSDATGRRASVSIMPPESDGKPDIPACDAATILREASEMVEGLVSEYDLPTALAAGVWGDFDQWASARAEAHDCSGDDH